MLFLKEISTSWVEWRNSNTASGIDFGVATFSITDRQQERNDSPARMGVGKGSRP